MGVCVCVNIFIYLQVRKIMRNRTENRGEQKLCVHIIARVCV